MEKSGPTFVNNPSAAPAEDVLHLHLQVRFGNLSVQGSQSSARVSDVASNVGTTHRTLMSIDISAVREILHRLSIVMGGGGGGVRFHTI